MNQLVIKNLKVQVEEKMILKGINLVVNEGEVHALMGPNGNGKSTLLLTIMGHPNYEIVEGDILWNNQSLLTLSVDKRSRLGLFLAMQNPVEIPGLLNLDFLKASINAHRETPIKLFELYKTIENTTKSLQMNPDMMKRYLNNNFSGGEKKKNEILQMNLLAPKIALIDEIDSGLDVDALNVVSAAINEQIANRQLPAIIVSHYDRFFNLVKPTHAHVLVDGVIVESGDNSLVNKINTEGYQWLFEKYEINKRTTAENKTRQVGLGCSAQKGQNNDK